MVKKKRIANKSLMFGLPYFWHSNQVKGLNTPIYVKVSESVNGGHTAKNTLGFGVSSFHGVLKLIAGKLAINQ